MRSWVVFEVRGLNQLKLLNDFYKSGIVVKSLVRCNQKTMSFKVASKSKTQATSLMDKQGFAYEVKQEISFAKSLKSLLPRLGLVVGALLMIALSIYSSTYLWKIEINGNERVDELTIIKTLKQSGIWVGGKKNFDRDFVEETLMALDEVSAVSAEVFGTTLKIDIVESALVSPQKQRGDVISLYDAEITRIIVNSGAANVKIGDRVPAGATLIQGVEYDTEGKPLFDVNAQGEIYGKVNFTYSETRALQSKRRTGNVMTSTTINLFGINVGKSPSDLPQEYETEKTVSQIGSLFPLTAQTTRYYELESYELTIQELTDAVVKTAVNNLIIKAGGSAISTTANSKLIADNVYRITVHIEAEISIGGKKLD